MKIPIRVAVHHVGPIAFVLLCCHVMLPQIAWSQPAPVSKRSTVNWNVRKELPAEKRFAADLVPLLTYGGLILEPTEQQLAATQEADVAKLVERLTQENAPIAIRELTKEAQEIAQSAAKMHQLWGEFTREIPGPQMTFWKTMRWVMDESEKGAFREEVTIKEFRSNGLVTERTEIHDGTLNAAALYGMLAYLHDVAAQRQHAVKAAVRRNALSKELAKQSDRLEQLRLRAAEKLTDVAFSAFAGPERAEPVLSFRISRVTDQGTPIEEWEKQRKREEADRRQVAAVRRPDQPPESIMVTAQPRFVVKNPGPTLHHVALTVDYFHYRYPAEAVMRQVYFLPEWSRNAEIAITDTFRVNLANRATAGLRESVLEESDGLARRTSPGFLGVYKVAYSLSCDEIRQRSVVTDLVENRELLLREALATAEEWAYQLLPQTGAYLANLKPQERLERVKLITQTAREFAKSAAGVAVENSAEKSRAEALVKDLKSISKRHEAIKEEILEACQPGLIYSGALQYSHKYELEFIGSKPTASNIQAKWTSWVSNPPIEKTLQGKLVADPDRLGWMLQFSEPTLEARADKVRNKTSRPTTSPADQARQQAFQQRNDSVNPVLWFENGQWTPAYSNAFPTLALTGKREPSELMPEKARTETVGKTTAKSKTTANSPKTAGKVVGTRLPIDSAWEGTRQFVDANGKVLSEEKIVVTIRKSPFSNDPYDKREKFDAEFVFDGKHKMTGDVSLSIDGRIELRARTGRRSDPYRYPLRGKLLPGGKIEGAESAGSGKPETELVRLQLKK